MKVHSVCYVGIRSERVVRELGSVVASGKAMKYFEFNRTRNRSKDLFIEAGSEEEEEEEEEIIWDHFCTLILIVGLQIRVPCSSIPLLFILLLFPVASTFGA
jgi:hypothetical protein